MIKCKYCGATVQASDEGLCPKCGANLGSSKSKLDRCAHCMGLFSSAELTEVNGKSYCPACGDYAQEESQEAPKSPDGSVLSDDDLIKQEKVKQGIFSKQVIFLLVFVVVLVAIIVFRGGDDDKNKAKNDVAQNGTPVNQPTIRQRHPAELRLLRLVKIFKRVASAEASYIKKYGGFGGPQDLINASQLGETELQLEGYKFFISADTDSWTVSAKPDWESPSAMYYSYSYDKKLRASIGEEPDRDATVFKERELPLPYLEGEDELVAETPSPTPDEENPEDGDGGQNGGQNDGQTNPEDEETNA